MFTLGELVSRFGLGLINGEVDTRISGLATLAQANSTHLSFFTNSRYRQDFTDTRAGAVVVAERDAQSCPVAALVSKEPAADFARIAQLFAPAAQHEYGVHASAVVEFGAKIAENASIGAHCFIHATARIGAGAVLGPGCIVGEACEVGEACQLIARVTLVKRVRLGRAVLIHPGAVLGADGFGLAMSGGAWLKVPQFGGVEIGDYCEIGANTTIDCGALEDTVLAADVKLDNQIQIGHNVSIGEHTAIAGCSGIAGSARIGRNCLIAGGVGIVGHVSIADGTTIHAMSMVSHTLHERGEYAGAMPLTDHKRWRRNAVRMRQLDELLSKLLEKQRKPAHGP